MTEGLTSATLGPEQGAHDSRLLQSIPKSVIQHRKLSWASLLNKRDLWDLESLEATVETTHPALLLTGPGILGGSPSSLTLRFPAHKKGWYCKMCLLSEEVRRLSFALISQVPPLVQPLGSHPGSQDPRILAIKDLRVT